MAPSTSLLLCLLAVVGSYAAALPLFVPLLPRQATEVPAYVKSYGKTVVEIISLTI